jgi:hypothetical protein
LYIYQPGARGRSRTVSSAAGKSEEGAGTGAAAQEKKTVAAAKMGIRKIFKRRFFMIYPFLEPGFRRIQKIPGY